MLPSNGETARSCHKNRCLSKTCLFIRGLSPYDNDRTIRQQMLDVGVSDTAIVYTQAVFDKQTGRCKGLGFVQLHSEQDACMALQKLSSKFQVEMALEAEKDPTCVYVWNLPKSYYNSRNFIDFIIRQTDTRPNKKSFHSKNGISFGFISVDSKEKAVAIVQYINKYSDWLSQNFSCSERIAAKLADKRGQHDRQPVTGAADTPSIRFEDIIKPSNPQLCEISTDQFQLKDAESPFKWNAHEGSDKLPEDVIDTVAERISLEPMLASAYHGLLASYHSATSHRRKFIDFSKAKEHLKDAFECGRREGEHVVKCDFVLEAISLVLEEQQNKRSPNFAERVKALAEAWNERSDAPRIEVRANAFHMKALAFFHQGINKYKEAEEAAMISLSIQPDNFLCVYRLAYIRSRLRRHKNNRAPADSKELLLWERSLELANQMGLPNRFPKIKPYYFQFLINYAEAILCNRDLKEMCRKFAHETIHAVRDFSAEIQEQYYRITLTCEKVFRILRDTSDSSELYEIMRGLAPRTQNSELLFRLAKQTLKRPIEELSREKAEDEYERLLLRAQKVSYEPGHFWVDVSLQQFRVERPKKFSEELILNEFDNMANKYRDFPRHAAVSKCLKGFFICCEARNIDSGFEIMVLAVMQCEQRWKALKSVRSKSERPEMEAWFRQHLLHSYTIPAEERKSISDLYQRALSSDGTNHQLVFEHLGLLHMSSQEFKSAVDNFRKLSLNHDRRSSLLSSALLKQAELTDGVEKEKLIVEAIRLKSPEACQPVVQLLEDRLSHRVRRPLEVIQQKYSPADADQTVQTVPWLHSKQSYELHALIHIASGESHFKCNHQWQNSTELQKCTLNLQHLEQQGQDHEEDRNKAIIQTLVEAKNCMDGLWSKLINSVGGECFEKGIDLRYFPYGFNFVKNCDDKVMISALNGKSHEERARLIKVKLEKTLQTKKCVAEELQQRVAAVRDLLSIRECKVFRDQKPFGWLVAWQDVVNCVKHDNRNQEPLANFVPKITEALGCDSSCAVEIAHMAVEFVEETSIIFEATTKELQAALGERQ